ncbi:SubName: Full=Uncharacterized protein {ECO:0000313/EMBL:CCA69169.1} [Serendipita indica DSM 11827]|uniref:Uncharacterized protein n=1 Tax=Serendipita indica (strain DSM 11827) TaxID=1109443 RepID=G4TCW7_SERID|nr:SubName: Full=Uncharacterized protein {ECO:0000313/EMBL:CCA69169.1} [Serendipita indica DSM 11827]CCA69169.1 hypothetical protein PIIN_03069 [Serendipita indica DSM 11827]
MAAAVTATATAAPPGVRRPLPDNSQRRNLPFALFHRQPTPPDPASPTNSIDSTGGLIYRDGRAERMDLLTMMPNPLRDGSPTAQPPGQPQQGVQQSQTATNGSNGAYQRTNRVPPPSMGDGELDGISPPNGISPSNSIKRIARENKGSIGTLNELGFHPQDPAAVGAARERDRPESRERERREKSNSVDKLEARRTPTNTQQGGPLPSRPSPYSFDSSSTLKPDNHSSADLLSLGNPRDSPVYDPNNGLASLESLKPGGGANGSMQKRQGSGDSLDLPNGEHGGWVSYDSADPHQSRSATEWDRKQGNQSYSNNSRFSPDRYPLAEEQNERDEEILSPPRVPGQQARPQATQTAQQPAGRRRDLPIPGQSQTMPHPREHSNSISQNIIPVPKTQHAQVIQSQQWTRRPSSPLAREPVVQAQNTSSEESDSYTPRSPHAALPEIPSLAPSYASNSAQQSPQHYQPSPTQQIQGHHQLPPHNQPQQPPVQNSRPMPPPAIVSRPRQNPQPMYEQHRGMPAMQLPMYTGASMATALSSISPSQSVSAVGSPHPQPRMPPGPPFGPSSSVFIQEGHASRQAQQLYSQLQQHGLGSKQSQRHSMGFSLDQGIAALNGQQYPPLNATNLSALKNLTPADLRAMGFGQPQPAQPLRTPKVDPKTLQRANGQGNNQRKLVETLDKAAGEVVELQDLRRAMEMNLDSWDSRDWRDQNPHRPVHTGNSAQYPSSHAVLPPGDRAKQKAAEDYEHQLQQLAAMGIHPNGSYASSSHMHHRPGNPIPPTPFSATSPNGQQFPRVLANGDGWIPVPNTDGYPPSYGELMSLYEQHNPGKQPSMRDVLMMQLAALASEPENVEGSVFSKSEAPFPPVGFNPFIQQNQAVQQMPDSARSSPRDPPGEFDKTLRRVPNMNGPPRRAPASSIFGGDGETEVSRNAPSTVTEGAGEDHDDDEGTTTEEDTRSNETAAAGGLRLNFDNSTNETLGASLPMAMQSTTNLNENHTTLNDLYPLFQNIIKSRAASVAPGAFGSQPQMQQQLQQQLQSPTVSSTTVGTEPWVEEVDSDEDLEADLEWMDDGAARYHPRFIHDEAKRRRKWEIKFGELVKAFHELDRLTDTPMILLATPPRSSLAGQQGPPVSHIAISRSIKRDQGYSRRAQDARLAYHNILVSPPSSARTESFQSVSPPSLSPPLWGIPRMGSNAGGGWSSASAGSLSDADAQMRAQMMAALGSLRLMNKVEERREERRRQEQIRQKDEREAVERMLKNLLAGVANSTSGSTGNAPSVSAGSPAGGSVRAESVGVPAPAEDSTPQGTDAGRNTPH